MAYFNRRTNQRKMSIFDILFRGFVQSGKFSQVLKYSGQEFFLKARSDFL